MHILACDLDWLVSPKDYWYAIISAMIGAGIGIWWTKRQFADEKQRDRKRSLTRLRACIQFNIDRLNQMADQLSKSEIPNYPLDTVQFNHWLAQSHDFLEVDLLKQLDWQRFQLDHVTSKLVVLNNAIVGQGTHSTSSTSASGPAISTSHLSSLQVHIRGILDNLPNLMVKIPSA